MSINHIPFYILWETYIDFINVNFPDLLLSDDALFIGFIILVRYILRTCLIYFVYI